MTPILVLLLLVVSFLLIAVVAISGWRAYQAAPLNRLIRQRQAALELAGAAYRAGQDGLAEEHERTAALIESIIEREVNRQGGGDDR